MRLRLGIMLLFVLLVSLTWHAAAQIETPPPLTFPMDRPDGQTWPFMSDLKMVTQDGGPPPAVPVGQPGLSFRYAQTIGVTREPYLTDAYHLNGPKGLFVDQADALYVAEERGNRVLKYNAAGLHQLTIGHAGDPLDDSSDHTGLNAPQDVAVDGAGNIWMVVDQAIKTFDSSGNLLQIYPSSNYWEVGEANDRFNHPRGLAFDSTGRLYVADSDNHRIQVFSFDGNITPVYSATIGLTGVWTTTNHGFNAPRQIAFDSSNRLYVADANNHRIQRCQNLGAWSCVTFFGESGVPGWDSTHLFWPIGLTVDHNQNLYVADTVNLRVLKCNLSGVCAHFIGVTSQQGTGNNYFWSPAGVAVDSAGNVYISDFGNHRVQKYDSVGVYLGTRGVTRTPYLPDTIHLNAPWGATATQDGGLLVTENGGYRLIKLDDTGQQQWTIGQTGAYGNDNIHFGAWWCGPEGSPTLDSLGRIYVPDTCNDRVQIFNPDGSFLATLGSTGSDPGQFSCPAGVAINPMNGDIYVVDKCNNRIQVFTSNRVYKTMLGVTGVSGADNSHFYYPRGITIDATGVVYIADTENQRVQKCIVADASYSCSTFVGDGSVTSDFGRLHPMDITLDAEGRIYVVDEWNNRVQVFNASGAFLTSIAGSWGSGQDQLIGPAGVTVDSTGSVYVVDRYNHRIQKFIRSVPEWEQKNINGFGDINNGWITELVIWHSYLYTAVANWTTGAEVWRSADGVTWSQVNSNGFGSAQNTIIYGMVEFSGYLHVGTNNDTAGGQIWRCQQCDGSDWTQISGYGLGDTDNKDTQPGVILNDYLYVDTANRATGCEIWRTPNGTTWQQVNNDGFGDANNWACSVQKLFNGQMYIGTYNETIGGQLWRYDETTWEQVGSNGLGDINNQSITPLITHQGYLYVGTWNETTGAEIWRSADGVNWVQTNSDGFGNANNDGVFDLMATLFDSELYVGVTNKVTGLEIWKSRDGLSWSLVSTGGFGDSNNNDAPAPLMVFDNHLYAASSNPANGTELWQYARIAGSDPYEPDDACTWASFITTNGEFQAHTFHANADADWVSFNAVAGTSYAIQATSTSTATDLVLELYSSCSGNPADTDDNAFGSSASLIFTAPATGVYYLKTLNDTPTDFGPDVTYELSVRRRVPNGLVLIVAGRDDNSQHQNRIIYAANLAYRTFLNAGIPLSNIRYLSAVDDARTDATHDGVSDVYDSSASVNIQTALTNWMVGLTNSQIPVYVYLVDHGGRDTFLAHGRSDTITAAELNSWLNTLETTTGAPVNVIYEACQSGSFIEGTEKISSSGRVIITSTGKDNNAYADPQRGAYFSDAFFTALSQNNDFFTAFQAAVSAVQATDLGQTPWLDDNGDGVPNSLGDGGLARTRGLINFALSGRPPVITELTALIDTGTIQARIEDDIAISRSWIVIYPPSFVEPTPTQDGVMPDLHLDQITLTDGDDDGLYTGKYDNFIEPGIYRLVVYAEDSEGNISQPGVLQVGIDVRKVYLPVILRP